MARERLLPGHGVLLCRFDGKVQKPSSEITVVRRGLNLCRVVLSEKGSAGLLPTILAVTRQRETLLAVIQFNECLDRALPWWTASRQCRVGKPLI